MRNLLMKIVLVLFYYFWFILFVLFILVSSFSVLLSLLSSFSVLLSLLSSFSVLMSLLSSFSVLLSSLSSFSVLMSLQSGGEMLWSLKPVELQRKLRKGGSQVSPLTIFSPPIPMSITILPTTAIVIPIQCITRHSYLSPILQSYSIRNSRGPVKREGNDNPVQPILVRTQW